MYVLLIEGCLCTEVAHMLMKDPKENPVISREPLLNSMKEKNEDFMKDTKKIIARRTGGRRGKGPKVEKFQVEKLDTDVGSPASCKSLMFHCRLGYGQLGTKCLVKANHFIANIPNLDICHYCVSVS